jgi:hypothetical protein
MSWIALPTPRLPIRIALLRSSGIFKMQFWVEAVLNQGKGDSLAIFAAHFPFL